MRAWVNLLGGMTLWAAHFLACYAIASVLPGRPLAPVLVGLATVLALAATLPLLRAGLRLWRQGGDDFERWHAGLALLGGGLAIVAIVFQGLGAAF